MLILSDRSEHLKYRWNLRYSARTNKREQFFSVLAYFFFTSAFSQGALLENDIKTIQSGLRQDSRFSLQCSAVHVQRILIKWCVCRKGAHQSLYAHPKLHLCAQKPQEPLIYWIHKVVDKYFTPE